ncbi:hypothetical protein Tco_0718755 [Tanacetum coccineum]
MTMVNMFVDIDTELVRESSKKDEVEMAQESSSKKAGDELGQEKAKKQKIDDDQEEANLKELMEVISDEEGVANNSIYLSTKPPSIVDYKIIKEGKISIYQIIRANGSSKRYSAVIHMLKNFDREDFETLWKIVKARHGYTRLEEGYERVLWGNLKTMFKHHVEYLVWRFWHVIHAGGNIFKVEMAVKHSELMSSREPAHVECGNLQIYSCRHSIAVIFKLNKRHEDYIPSCFRKDSYYKAYHRYLTLVGEMTFWPYYSMYSTALPPKPRKMSGRPRKQRIRPPPMKDNLQIECLGLGKGYTVGVEIGTNVGSIGVEIGNVDSVGVESSTGNETVRSARLGDFVSVRYEGTITATRLRGGLWFRVRRVTSEGTPTAIRGRGGQTLRLGVRKGTSEGTSTARRSRVMS